VTRGAIAVAEPQLDPQLPGLTDLLHPPPGGPAAGWRLHHVEWSPGRRCRVVYEVRPPTGAPTFVTHELTRTAAVTRPMEADPDLPGLAVALDAAAVAARLAAGCGGPARPCRVTPVAYRPRSRAVLAYDVAVPAGGPSRLFAKVLAAGSARSAAAATAITASARDRGVPAPVPEVAAVWPDLGAVVHRAASGRSLSSVLRDGGLPGAERAAAARLLGRLLATIHATPGHAEPPWTVEHELAHLEGLLAPAWHADPASGRALATLVDRLADRPPADDGAVLGHGAFRTGQALLDRGRLVVVDLDAVCRADPARDAGNALAYLWWAQLRGVVSRQLGRELREAFLAGYAESRAPLEPAALRWWSAASMAKIAGRRYRSLATAEWALVPALLAEARDQLTADRPRGGPAGGAGPVPSDPLDAAGMTDVLRGALCPPAGPHLRVLEARPLATAAGRRRVVAYLVAGLDLRGPTRVVGKTYADRHRCFVAEQNLRLLDGEVFARTPGLGVPRPLGRVPALSMVLYREAAGTPADRLDTATAVRVAAATAGWLAVLHAAEVTLARSLDLDNEVANAQAWAALVASHAPSARSVAFGLADRLAATAAQLPPVRPVPCHKDLHPGHVLACAGGGIVVLDLDEARMGDPAMDLAHACTYLEVSEYPGGAGAAAALRAAYGCLPGEGAPLRYAFFAAYTRMKIAKQLVTGRGPIRLPAGPAAARTLDTVLTGGVACLDG
jgi:aminoglycoside phosphotransferase (APT) family kinase protein